MRRPFVRSVLVLAVVGILAAGCDPLKADTLSREAALTILRRDGTERIQAQVYEFGRVPFWVPYVTVGDGMLDGTEPLALPGVAGARELGHSWRVLAGNMDGLFLLELEKAGILKLREFRIEEHGLGFAGTSPYATGPIMEFDQGPAFPEGLEFRRDGNRHFTMHVSAGEPVFKAVTGLLQKDTIAVAKVTVVFPDSPTVVKLRDIARALFKVQGENSVAFCEETKARVCGIVSAGESSTEREFTFTRFDDGWRLR